MLSSLSKLIEIGLFEFIAPTSLTTILTYITKNITNNAFASGLS